MQTTTPSTNHGGLPFWYVAALALVVSTTSAVAYLSAVREDYRTAPGVLEVAALTRQGEQRCLVDVMAGFVSMGTYQGEEVQYYPRPSWWIGQCAHGALVKLTHTRIEEARAEVHAIADAIAARKALLRIPKRLGLE